MANLATARAGLVTFGATVTKPGGGTFASYDLKSFYDAGSGATIPCFIAILDLEEQPGWQAFAMNGGASQASFVMYHYALWKAVEGNADFTYLEPEMVELIDNYQTALDTTPYLTSADAPAIHYAPSVHWKVARSTWGKTIYHSVIFRLECTINR